MAVGATVLIASASMAIVPLTASAQGSETTNTTVVAKPSSTVTAHAVTLVASVTAVTGVSDTVGHTAMRFHATRRIGATPNSTVPTGTVTFTVTGSGSGSATCKTSNTVAINHRGKASCRVLSGQLLAVDSPYSVTASYSGDDNFAASSGMTSLVVNRAHTKTRAKMGPSRPTNGSPNAVTATVKARGGNGLITGTVTFAVSSVPGTGTKTTCTNSNGFGGKKTNNTQPLAVSGNVATAVCDLQPGWFVLTKGAHPTGKWNVSASYSGDGNFLPSTGRRGGHSHM